MNDDFNATLRDGASAAWQTVGYYLPRVAIFLAILVIGYFLARALARIFDRVLERVHFDALVERGGIKQVLARTRYDASDLLSKVLFYALFLFVLQLAFGVFGPNPASDPLSEVILFLPNVLVAVVIVVVASAIAKGVKDIVGSLMSGLSYGGAVSTTASAMIVLVGVFAALSQLQIAPAIVNGLFYAMLAIVAGSAIIAIGGSGIQPLRAEWERALSHVHERAPRFRVGSLPGVAVPPEAQGEAARRTAKARTRRVPPPHSATSRARRSTRGEAPGRPARAPLRASGWTHAATLA
jgi:MFS family permease